MLTTLSTVKARLGIAEVDTTNDTLLQRAIDAISARFDRETNRTLARTEDAAFEFELDDTQIMVPCYPIESVTRFELKVSEAEGWREQAGIEYLIRGNCVICLSSALSLSSDASSGGVARVIYTGGYALPGSPPLPASAALPADLEQAAVEQTAYWFQTREQLGVIRQWPHGGNYVQFSDPDLLPAVREVLQAYARLAL